MKSISIKRPFLAALLLLPVLTWAQGQELRTIKLNEPNKTRGLPVMQALSVRASVRDWSEKDVSLQDLSDLLWAADGINRPESKKRTASSAQNAQDVDIYAFMKDGVYLSDAQGHALVPVAAGDYRNEIGMRPGGAPRAKPEGPPPTGTKPEGPPGAKPGGPQSTAPILLVLVSDISRFGGGTPELKKEWGPLIRESSRRISRCFAPRREWPRDPALE
jgi:hypothetical protein